MTLLSIGVLLWYAAHLFKRIAPERRAAMGEPGKGIMAAVLVVSLVLMVLGYRATPVSANLLVVPGGGHINNTLMLIAIVIFGAGMAKGALWTKIRHPMLWGVLLWSVAHLIVHNDMASLVLFGGMGLWAIISMAAINRAGPWIRPYSGGIKRDGVLVVISLVMFGLIVGIHVLLGMHPFLPVYA